MARTYEESVVMYGVTHEFTAHSTGKRAYNAQYIIAVDGEKVATATWRGGRKYDVEPVNGRRSYRFITGDGGRVRDVAASECYSFVHDAHDAAVKAAAEHPPCSDPGCHTHGIAASNARQSKFYAANDRTIEARS